MASYEYIIVLKDIAKELHKMNEKLDHIGQASIFNEQPIKYEYVADDCVSQEPPDFAK